MAESAEIDFNKIRFPSDRLTLQNLRRLSPDHFDPDKDGLRLLFDDSPKNPMLDVLELIHLERHVAQGALWQAQGHKSDYLDDMPGYAEDVAKLYIHFGIAKGQHHADELVRNLQSQAAAQAPQRSGGSS